LKTFLKLTGLTLIFFVAILIGCNKSMDQISTDDNLKSNFVNPKENVGILHNEALKYVLEKTTEIPPSKETKAFVEKILNEKYENTSLSSIPAFPGNFNDLDLSVWIDNFEVSEDLKVEAKKTFDLFKNANNLNEILISIENREVEANTIFSGSELDLYYEHLAVARHTAIFWYPVDQGGLDGFQYLAAGSLKSTNAVNWWKVLGVDCIGGWMGGAVGYAGASLIAVIMQL